MEGAAAWSSKEDFYRGHTGAGKLELLALASCLSLAICLSEELKLRLLPPPALALPGAGSISGTCSMPMRLQTFLLELLVVVLPQLALFMGALPPGPTCCTLLTLVAASWVAHACVPLQQQAHQSQQQQHPGESSSEQDPPAALLGSLLERVANLAGPSKRWVSCFRGGLMLYTIISILAVDFRAFPRRYAKTEAFGTGLMDMGVGAMMVGGGMVSRAARRPPPAGTSLLQGLKAGLRAAAPCWVLWGLRLVSLRAVNYHEHVGEYGVHWNFFASVAVVELLAHAVRVRPSRLPLLAAAVTAGHQVLLSQRGLGAWVVSDERDMRGLQWEALGLGGSAGNSRRASGSATLLSGLGGLGVDGLVGMAHRLAVQVVGCVSSLDMGSVRYGLATSGVASLLDMNKEGLASVAGYWALYLWGAVLSAAATAALHGPADAVAVGAAVRPALVRIAALAAADALLWGAVAWAEAAVSPVSRRQCNLAFILWVCAFSGALVLPLMVGQVLHPRGLQPCLPAAFNRNMLALFLAANLLTGLVNLGVDTLAVPDTAARLLVGAYTTLVCGLAACLDSRGLSLGSGIGRRMGQGKH